MIKVLVVDDEPLYGELIAQALSADNHQVKTATSGREGLDVGARFHPDVLITDWMLKDDVHGLHVVEVLRAFFPHLRSVMMTGFPSLDLRRGADKAGVHSFLVKPFDALQIRTAVQEAALCQEHPSESVSLAMIEIDSSGSIVFANDAARGLMSDAEAGPNATSLTDLFVAGAMPDLDVAVHRCVAAPLRSPNRQSWHIRSQEPLEDGSRLIVVRRWNEPQLVGSALVEMMLGIRDSRRCQWPFDQRVLVVDDEPMLRRLFVSMLEGIGAGCYSASTHDEAWRLLEKDDGIGFLILDFDMPGAHPRTIVEKLKAARPDVVIVGNSGSDHRSDFTEIGVKHYLSKPWQAEEMVDALLGRIGHCASCGLLLPLRQARPGENASHWECSGCGRRYLAVFDDDCPPDSVSNVRQT